MSKVFFDAGISVDGLFAGPNRGPCNPLGDGGVAIHHGGWSFCVRLLPASCSPSRSSSCRVSGAWMTAASSKRSR
jgi:hypothetical protein